VSQDDDFRIAQLSLQGFGCSQVLIIRALEAAGKSSPELIKAVSALHGGLGFSGKLCGALTGGCCVIGLHAGRSEPEASESSDLTPLVQELVRWFEEEFGQRYGGIDCDDILADDPRNRTLRCPEIISKVAAKVDELLAGRTRYEPP
jgi:C_GCAxxG_C_C family probable redox protein